MTGIRRVSTGQAITSDIVTSDAWNLMADAAEAHAATTNGVQTSNPSPLVVQVRNKHATKTLKRFATVALEDPIFTDDGTGSPRGDAFDVNIPSEPETVNLLAIVQDPIPPMGMGRATIFGVSPVGDLDVVDEAHTRGRVGSDGKMTTSEEGPAILLWKSGPGENRTGIAAIVQGYSSATYFARIIGSTENGPNRWIYDFELVRANGTGAWMVILDDEGSPRTSETLGPALNSIEAGNTAGGIQGNGVDADTIPQGFQIVPVGVGAIVQIRGPIGATPTLEGFWSFSAMNLVDGECEG